MLQLPANLCPAQAARLKRFGVTASVDVHCHCLPGLDDGPATSADAIALCRLLVQDGTTTVIATPHALGRYEGRNAPSEVRAAVLELNALLDRHRIPLIVLPGADLRVDEMLAERVDCDEVLTSPDGGRYLLLELPHDVAVRPERLLRDLGDRGVSVVLTHPERNRVLNTSLNAIDPWIRGGAILQITAGSLLGEFGRRACDAAWNWLAAGSVALVASDAHGVDARPPRLTDAIDVIASRFGDELAGDVCVRNPLELTLAKRLVRREAAALYAAGGVV